MTYTCTVSTNLTHDENVRVEALQLAIAFADTQSGRNINSDVVLQVAQKFEAFIRERVGR